MIDKITIINFQSHKKTILRLCHGINGIIGRSNRGKSAIFRAIELVRSNRPSGFSYHSNFARGHYTKVFIKNQNEDIRFVKMKSKAEYVIHRKETFAKFGRQVPDRITSALNLDDINFSSQLGLPYLITSPPSEIARVINQVTKAEDIEKCISLAKTHATKYKSKKQRLHLEISDISKRLKRFTPMAKLKRLIKKTEVIERKIERDTKKIKEIKTIVDFLKTADNAVLAEEQLLKPAELINKAESLQAKIDGTFATIALIEQAINMNEQIIIAKKEKNSLIKQYTMELKKEKKCPYCLSRITNKQLQHVRNELK